MEAIYATERLAITMTAGMVSYCNTECDGLTYITFVLRKQHHVELIGALCQPLRKYFNYMRKPIVLNSYNREVNLPWL